MAQQLSSGSMVGTMPQVMVSTTGEVPGYKIDKYLGVSFGITVRSRGAGGQCLGGCQTCFGGEIGAYTQNSLEARNDAIFRLVSDVQAKGGNAVIGVRFDSSRSGNQGNLMDIVAYGTAVIVSPK